MLTPREREIAQLTTECKSNKEIARALYISKRTVDTHLRNIYQKLDLVSRTGLALWMRENGGTHDHHLE